MLPLHAAFERNYPEGQQQIADHIARFHDAAGQRPARSRRPDQLASVLLLPQPLHGARRRSRPRRPDSAELPEALEIGSPSSGGATRHGSGSASRSRAAFGSGWNGSSSDAKGRAAKAFEHAILDQELFLFAIAADLRHYGRTVGSPLAHDPVLEEVDRFSRRVYDARAKWNADSGWTFQPGIWRDHPDHVYDCWTEKKPGLSACAIAGGVRGRVAPHRFPLWMRSSDRGGAGGVGGAGRTTRGSVGGWSGSSSTGCWCTPSPEFAGYRCATTWTGRTGSIAGNTRASAPTRGTAPTSSRAALMNSWWGFLPGPRARQLFHDIAGNFPSRIRSCSSTRARVRRAGRRQHPTGDSWWTGPPNCSRSSPPSSRDPATEGADRHLCSLRMTPATVGDVQRAVGSSARR